MPVTDGFCLWPSKHTEHSVKNSPWRGGEGDVVQEVSEACRRHGVKFGVYLLPWDRHERTYGSDAYNQFYYRSVGRNSVLLLNVPPDRRGRLHENDAARLCEFRAVLDETFKTNLAAGAKVTAEQTRAGFDPAGVTDGDGQTYWTTQQGVVRASLLIDVGRAVSFDRAMVQEMITTGQRVEAFTLEAQVDGQWKEIAKATTIGHKRLLRFPEVTASKVRLTILDSRDSPTIREFGLFKAAGGEKTSPSKGG